MKSCSSSPATADDTHTTAATPSHAPEAVPLTVKATRQSNAAVSAAQRTPVAVTGLTEVIQIAAGAEHACALRADGTVWCWGRNQYGQAGNDTVDRAAPAAVAGVSGAVALGVGTNTSCAIKSDGTAWCWGRNNSGQLGDGTTVDSIGVDTVDASITTVPLRTGLTPAVILGPWLTALIVLAAAGALTAQQYSIDTFAGIPLDRGYFTDGSAATTIPLDFPLRVAIDGKLHRLGQSFNLPFSVSLAIQHDKRLLGRL